MSEPRIPGVPLNAVPLMASRTDPPLVRCPRGHATPAGKTFCDACGALLEAPLAARPAPPTGEDVVPEPRRRRRLRRPSVKM